MNSKSILWIGFLWGTVLVTSPLAQASPIALKSSINAIRLNIPEKSNKAVVQVL